MIDLLTVVDVQNGFVNEHTRPVVPVILKLVRRWREREGHVAFPRFVNREDGPHERWIGWTRFTEAPENALVAELDAGEEEVFVKHGYTAFTPAFEAMVRHESVSRLLLCGIATDGCVLKTAVDAFEREVEPVVLADACASHAGEEVHEAGLMLIRRFIGKGQVRTVAEVVGE